MQDDHAQNGRALRDIGQRDHRPEVGAAVGVDQLGVDGVGHVVQTGHNDRCVQQAEQCGKEQLDIGCKAHVDDICDKITDFPANRADHGVCDEYSGNKCAEGNDNHADDFRANLLEEFFKIDQDEACQDGRDDLTLIADHLYLCKAEIPDRNVFGCGGCDREAV